MPFDFATVSAPFRMQPGLRRLERGTQQLTPNRLGARALREKLAVLFHHAGQALLATPDFDARPALSALMRHAVDEHPDDFAWDGAMRFEARQLGWSVDGDCVEGGTLSPEIGACLRALPPPCRLAGLLSLAFAEDFAVIDGTTAHIPWLAVCLPSHWAPEDKVGKHFAQVHAPVADNRLLVTASQHLARLVTGDEPWERFVWTITRHPRLHAHPMHCDDAPWPAAATAAQLADAAFFRTEHQTFIPLPEARQAIFTIHVQSGPLRNAFDTPAQAGQVHEALRTMSPAVLAYRGLTDARDRLLAWLTEQARE